MSPTTPTTPASLTPAQQRQLAALVTVYPQAGELGRRFSAAGFELYLVGGTVRDTLLNRAGVVADLDFATSASPDDSRHLLAGWADDLWLTGAAFGTVSARKDQTVFEVTTFRTEAYRAGSRHPEVTFAADIRGDLSRRDLTINAMAVGLHELSFIDPFGGLRDLRAGVLRTPIDPAVSFGDDPLRMVRLARFAATLGFSPDAETAAAATKMAPQIDTVSRERIRDELNRLLSAPNHATGLDLLCDTGLAQRFLPELPALRMERDPLHHHKDVYAHTLAVVDGCPTDDLVLRLAALLHDVGKPATREFHAGGKVSFHHHEVVGARMARARLRELRYPKEVVAQVSDLVFLHLRFHGYGDGAWTDAAVRRYVRDAGSDIQLRRLNQLSRADVTTKNRAKARKLDAAMDDLEARIEVLAQQEVLSNLRPAIDGHTIMQYLGIPPGPLVGKAYEMLLDARIEQGPMVDSDAFALLDAWAVAQGIDRGQSTADEESEL